MVWITLPHEYDEDERQWIRNTKPLRMQSNAYNADNFLDFLCDLNVDSLSHKTCRATNIACNVGYAINRSIESLEKMMECGMNIARVNLALNYGNFEYHSETIKNIRQAAKNYSKKLGAPFPVAIACNTIGPTVLTGYLEGGLDTKVDLKAGNIVKVTTDPAFREKGSAQVIYIDYEEVFDSIIVGRIIWIDDGSIKLKVKAIAGAFMTCDIEIGGILGSKKNVKLPGTTVNLPPLCEMDKVALQYAIAQNFDFVFCTYIRDAEAILEIRKELGVEGRHIKLVANIEDLQGLSNLAEIINVCDAVVVARGDLLLEVTIPKLFMTQKYIIAMCNKVGRPVIVSKELMETMMEKGIPTRADVVDVSNAVIDGCDGLMLARETTQGNYLLNIIKFVSQICKEAEAVAYRSINNYLLSDWTQEQDDLVDIISMTAVDSSIKVRAAAIFVLTATGFTARVVAKYRPRCPIIAITRDERVARQLNVYRSIIPFQYTARERNTARKDIDAQVASAIRFGKKRRFIKANDPIVIVNSVKNGKTNTMRIHYVSEKIKVVNNVMCVS